ncbi:acyltransferase family protein [Candidatus Pelagibacter sp.]|nr:acyltransferase family protein [Candidatus Pelagibacter sp.]
MKHRLEIDGLRALAVVPVILFHAGFELFGGGFVGVDVFFVISGYLITTILIDDIEKKRFSIINFYERRARRILPALFFVMFVCIPFAWIWMIPSQMRDFSQSLVAVSFFVSNILFWFESGYFNAEAEEKPLLHTWSLAVEEQYYVLFPIFLVLSWRFGKNRVFWMIVAMAVISLLISEWGSRNKVLANFYLSPSRAWEIFVGSIAAFIIQKIGVRKNNQLALLGLFAIIFSIFYYDETTPFPSMYTLVPVLGVFLIVLFAEKETFAAKFLSTKIFVGIGLISYSAYLWHQPLFAFARIKLKEEPTNTMMIVLCIVSFLLAIASWRYVEKPSRNRKLVSKKSITIFSMVGLFLFTFLGLSIHFMSFQEIGRLQGFKTDIYQLNFDELKKNSLKYTASFAHEDTQNFVSEKVKILILGDSVADDFVAAVKVSNKLMKRYEVRHLNFDDHCFNPSNFARRHSNCNSLIKNIKNNENLLLSADLIITVVGFHSKTDLQSFITTNKLLKRKLILIGSAHFKDPFTVFTDSLNSEHADTLAKILATNKLKRTLKNNKRAKDIAENYGVKFFSLYDIVCTNNEYCPAIDNNGKLLIFDTTHRTEEGIHYLSSRLEEFEDVLFRLN